MSDHIMQGGAMLLMLIKVDEATNTLTDACINQSIEDRTA